MTDISVVICTHNPRSDYLHRALMALRAQTLPTRHWDLLIVDNKSDGRVADAHDLSWHPTAWHVREDCLGLTHARFRGIAEPRSGSAEVPQIYIDHSLNGSRSPVCSVE